MPCCQCYYCFPNFNQIRSTFYTIAEVEKLFRTLSLVQYYFLSVSGWHDLSRLFDTKLLHSMNWKICHSWGFLHPVACDNILCRKVSALLKKSWFSSPNFPNVVMTVFLIEKNYFLWREWKESIVALLICFFFRRIWRSVLTVLNCFPLRYLSFLR